MARNKRPSSQHPAKSFKVYLKELGHMFFQDQQSMKRDSCYTPKILYRFKISTFRRFKMFQFKVNNFSRTYRCCHFVSIATEN